MTAINVAFSVITKEDLSPRYTLYGIPNVLSYYIGKEYDYTTYTEVHNIINEYNNNGEIQLGVNEIKNWSSDRIDKIDKKNITKINGDNKGITDISLLAFLLGSDSIEFALNYLIFIIFALSCLIFIILNSHKILLKLIVVSTVLIAFVFTENVILYSTQISGLSDPRIFDFLALIPFLHIILYILNYKNNLNALNIAGILLQIGIIIFISHSRSSLSWVYIGLIFFILAAVAKILLYKKIKFKNIKIKSKLFFYPLLIVFVLFYSFNFILDKHQKYYYNKVYFTTDTNNKILWHTVLMGLSSNVYLRNKYKILPVDDQSVTEAVKRSMQEKLRNNTISLAEYKSVFSHDEFAIYARGNFLYMDWLKYEKYAKKLYFQIFFEDFFSILKNYSYDAPLEIIKSYIAYVDSSLICSDSENIVHCEYYDKNYDAFSNFHKILIFLLVFTLFSLNIRKMIDKKDLILLKNINYYSIITLVICSIPAVIAGPHIIYLFTVIMLFNFVILTLFFLILTSDKSIIKIGIFLYNKVKSTKNIVVQ